VFDPLRANWSIENLHFPIVFLQERKEAFDVDDQFFESQIFIIWMQGEDGMTVSEVCNKAAVSA
jgi:hypothetical protein